MEHQSGADRADLYRDVSNKIVAQIEAGAGNFRLPWHHAGSPFDAPTNALTYDRYRGINVLLLWVASNAAGYPTGLWATYKQWTEIGAQVRKEERGTVAVFWKRIHATDKDPAIDAADENGAPRFVARRFWLFNAAQVEGYVVPEVPPASERSRIASADAFVRHLGIETRFGGDRAYYVPARDHIQMPPFERFRDAISFHAVHLHECAHASGAAHRLNRTLDTRFGSEAYAMEEMIADWAACLVCATLEIAPEPRPDHAQYISSWLKVLKDDKRAVFTAASKAQEIADWMWRQQSSAAA